MSGRIRPAPSDESATDAAGTHQSARRGLEGRSLRYTIKSTLARFGADSCTDLAAGLTYYAVLSVFPLLLALVSIIQLLGQADRLVPEITALVGRLASPETTKVITNLVGQFLNGSAGRIMLVVGIMTALWSASSYVGAFSRAMNRIYQVPEGRDPLRLKLLQLGQTMAIIVMMVLILAGLVISEPVARWVGGIVGWGDQAATLWSVARWPLIGLVAVVHVAMLYNLGPNVKQPRVRWLSPGALLTLALIVVGSVGFGFYLRSFASYDRTYGTLAGGIIALLFIWLLNVLLLLGAEFEAALERVRQLQSGIAAEYELQLTPRSTASSHRALARTDRLAAEGQQIREEAMTWGTPTVPFGITDDSARGALHGSAGTSSGAEPEPGIHPGRALATRIVTRRLR